MFSRNKQFIHARSVCGGHTYTQTEGERYSCSPSDIEIKLILLNVNNSVVP
jgi:hypothetical protein